MSNLTTRFIFEGNTIRVDTRNGEPWFINCDVCDILGIVNSRDAYYRLDADEKGVALTDTPGGNQEMQAVNEFGLYSLVLSSRKPEAKQFKRWITHEVIPSIRKTGSYSSQLTPTEALLKSVELLAKQERELAEIKETQSKSNAILVEHEFALATLDQKITEEITLNSHEQFQVQGAVKARVCSIGYSANYFSNIYSSLKRQFGIGSYKDLRRSDPKKAFEFIKCWTPSLR